MNWVSNLCGCITPQLQTAIISYLNSSELNQQVIEEQKCTEKYEKVPTKHSVYEQAKSKSYHAIQYNHENEEEDNYYKHREQEIQQKQQDSVIDSFWYPSKQFISKSTKKQLYQALYKEKSNVLRIILSQHPNTTNFDKIYDSQDDLNLTIYCKTQNLNQGKRINTFRFSFTLENNNLTNYEQWLQETSQKTLNQRKIEQLLQSGQIIEQIESPPLTIEKRFYKKVLIISPHSFVTAFRTQKIEQQSKEEQGKQFIHYLSTYFSVKEDQEASLIDQGKVNRGWVNLCGMDVSEEQTEEGTSLKFQGYLNVDLNVSLSPNMLKQPIAKQIRIFVQKIACQIKKSDQL